MRIQIRNSVFETNSSSIHTIAITKYNGSSKNNITLEAQTGNFGWEHKLYMLPKDKLSYLWTAIYCLADNVGYYENEFKKDIVKHAQVIKEWEEIIFNAFSNYNINIEFIYSEPFALFGYGIDHSNELIPMLNDFKENPELIVDFVLGNYSNVETYNDNSEYTLECPDDVEYAYVFTKGN